MKNDHHLRSRLIAIHNYNIRHTDNPSLTKGLVNRCFSEPNEISVPDMLNRKLMTLIKRANWLAVPSADVREPILE